MAQNSNPTIAFVFFFVWLAFLLLGKYQFGIIKKISTQYVNEKYDLLIQKNKNLKLRSFRDQIKDEWLALVEKKVLFVPHQQELWPMPATPKYLAERLPFSVGWVAKVLIENGRDLKDAEMKRIKEILANDPKARRRKARLGLEKK